MTLLVVEDEGQATVGRCYSSEFFPLVNDIVHAHLTRKSALKSSTPNSKAYWRQEKPLAVSDVYDRLTCLLQILCVLRPPIYFISCVIAVESMARVHKQLGRSKRQLIICLPLSPACLVVAHDTVSEDMWLRVLRTALACCLPTYDDDGNTALVAASHLTEQGCSTMVRCDEREWLLWAG